MEKFRIFEAIRPELAVLQHEGSLADAVVRLGEILKREAGFDVIEFAREFDFETELERASEWLSNVFDREPPEDEIRALWFGLFQSARPSEVVLYVAGSDQAAEDESNEWAVGPAWWPDARYFDSKVLARVPSAVKEAGRERGAVIDYVFPLAYSALLVPRALPKGQSRFWNDGQGIAVGFDEGDCILLARPPEP